MRRSVLAAALAAAFLASSARGAPEDPTIDSSLRPSSTAKVGDWLTLHCDMKNLNQTKPLFVTFTVESVSDKDGVVVRVNNNHNADKPKETWKTNDKPRLGPFLRLIVMKDREPHITEMKHAGGNQKIGDKNFSCKKLVFHAGLFTDEEFDCELYLSPDVKCLGIVALEMRQKKAKGAKPELARRYEVVGWGSAEKTDWGNTAGELLSKPAKVDNDTKLPQNPFEKAKAGDWGAVRLRPKFNVNAKEIPDSTFFTWRVEKVDGDKVVISTTRSDSRAEKSATFSKKDPPTLGAYLALSNLFDDPWLSEMTTGDETRTFLEKEFALKRISYVTTRGSRGNESLSTKNTIWISPDLPGFGLVAYESKGDRLELEVEVIGWGTDGEAGKAPVRVGKTAEEAEKDEKARKAEREKAAKGGGDK
ncbi:hypothetical protein HY251_03415 [bacterium]|nr:hypothetical protein [bacterium]